MLLQNKRVAIIGGGPGGLTLARLLQMRGVEVRVYERDLNKNARVQGSPLDLHEDSGLEAIRRANLLDAFKVNFLPGADKMLILNEQAEVFFSDHETKTNENFGDKHFRPEIARGALRKILLESLQPATVVWDSHFLSMTPLNEGWTLHFKNGASAYADIVVAADGANSRVRPYLTDIKPFYTGITMLEGNIHDAENTAPNIHRLLKGGKIMAFGNTRNILMGQKDNGEIGFYISFRTNPDQVSDNLPDYSDKKQVLSWFQKEYAGWNSIWHELFESATLPFILRPINCMPISQTWNSLPNLTLLGDAAHVMPPFAGEGANMAMLDALELSECLTSGKYKTLQDAISSYENRMRRKAAAAAQESLENGERMHKENALQDMLNMFAGHGTTHG